MNDNELSFGEQLAQTGMAILLLGLFVRFFGDYFLNMFIDLVKFIKVI